MNILIVDHSKVFRAIWERMVLRAGHEPLMAVDAASGLRLLRERRVDLIGVSYSLPDQDGISFTRKARRMSYGRAVPIILLTSIQNNDTRRRAFDAGVTDIQPKTEIESLFKRALRLASQAEDRFSGRVLYVEDSPTVARVMMRIMTEMGLEVEHHVNASRALECFDSDRHDLVISDVLVEGEMSGIALVSRLREQQPDKTRLPILAMSAMEDDIRRVELFRAGINDFIEKPVIREEARARIGNLITNKQLFDQVQQQRLQLYELAMTDPLTGLYNRNSLNEFARKLSAAANRHDMALSIILIDIDHFKKINDQHGHLIGDEVLAGIGEMLLDSCREEDFAVRFGGEEILLVLPHCGFEDAVRRAEELRQRLTELKPAGIAVTASMGVTARHPDHPLDLEALLRAADKAVYQAKANGRNRVECLLLPSEDNAQFAHAG